MLKMISEEDLEAFGYYTDEEDAQKMAYFQFIHDRVEKFKKQLLRDIPFEKYEAFKRK